jgi:hypothetical protein
VIGYLREHRVTLTWDPATATVQARATGTAAVRPARGGAMVRITPLVTPWRWYVPRTATCMSSGGPEHCSGASQSRAA